MGVHLRHMAVCSVTLLGLWSQLSWAHAFPHHSEPKVGATVAVPPSRVQIWFDGALEPLFCSIRVHDANGRRVDTGDEHVDTTDSTLLETTVLPLAPGIYRVVWSVVARDGHRTEGDFTFTLPPKE
jgi:methionine-rich copper-binding protein CopC